MSRTLSARMGAPVRLLLGVMLALALTLALSGDASAAKVRLFQPADIRKACEAGGGAFVEHEYGWMCTLPNGDQVWCDYVHNVCGYTDRGKPAINRGQPAHTARPGAHGAQLAPVARVVAKAAGGGGGGRTDTLRATCEKVEHLIGAYEQLVDGGGALGSAVDSVPGLDAKLRGELNDAKQFKEQVCDPVLG